MSVIARCAATPRICDRANEVIACTSVADPAAILVQCPTLKNPVGCAKVAQDRSWCKIYIVSDEYINSKGSPAIRTLFGYSYQNVLRHEIAHCNGWPSDHPRKIETTKKETTP